MARPADLIPDIPLTQVKAPALPSRLVARPRLARLLRAAKNHRLLLVVAPAGFGKTTALSQWARTSRLPSAWVTLDESSNDPARFWRNFSAAVRLRFPRRGRAARQQSQAWSAPSEQTSLTAVINDLAALDGAIAIILDDYDCITNAATHAAIGFLIEHLPEQAHLIVAARAEPPWPGLPRWRAQGQLLQLSASDLAFTPQEVTVFFHKLGLHLSAGDSARLAQRSEGWVTALQLAALSLRANPNVEQFLPSFDGRQRHLFDYLTGEVLGQQPADIQQFLLRTSILDRLAAPVCNAILDRRDSQAMLEVLAARGLFLFGLDDGRQWFRYHPLFADFLRGRLRREAPELEPALHSRASCWFEANGLLDDAIEHGLAAGDWQRAAGLVEGAVERVLWQRGEHLIVQGWLRRLPEAGLLARPPLLLCDAWLLIWSNRLEAAENRLDQAARAWANPATAGARWGELAAARASLARARGDAPGTVAAAREALACLGPSDWLLRGQLQANLGNAQRLLGDVLEAQTAFRESYGLLKRTGSTHLMLHVLGNLMQMQVQQGDLVAAAATDRRASALVAQHGQSPPTAGIVDIARGELLRERNALGPAEQAFRNGLALCAEWPGLVEARLEGYLGLFHLALCRNELGQAAATLRQAEAESRPYDVAAWEARLGLERASLWLRQGRLAEAAGWMASLPPADSAEAGPRGMAPRLPALLLSARIWLAEGKLAQCRALLGRLGEAAGAMGLTRAAAQACYLEAQAWLREGDKAAATVRMSVALALGRPQQYVWLFLEDGEISAALLNLAARAPGLAGYVERLLATQRATASRRPVPLLTRREIEVLKLVARGLSNEEIARDLTVASGTVRRHLENIYTKLDARSRTRSVARARELGLL